MLLHTKNHFRCLEQLGYTRHIMGLDMYQPLLFARILIP
jgi:hypothetical protein